MAAIKSYTGSALTRRLSAEIEGYTPQQVGLTFARAAIAAAIIAGGCAIGYKASSGKLGGTVGGGFAAAMIWAGISLGVGEAING